MEPFRLAFCGLLLFTLTALVAAQSDLGVRCRGLPDGDELETAISESFITSDSPTPPDITLQRVHYVCEAPDMFRGTYSHTSLLATYNCTGSALCRGGGQEPSQFDFQCVNGAWSPVVIGSSDFSFIEQPGIDFTTPTDTRCALCVNPEQLRSEGSTAVADPVTHCVECDAGCNQGAMMCFGRSSDECCNFYNGTDDKCLNMCPAGQQPDGDFICRAITVGFADATYQFSEGDVGNATVIVFGVAARDFSVLYLNEFLGISGELEIAAGTYLTGRSFVIPIDYPDNDVALQNDVVFQITLLPHPRFLDDVTFGSGGVKGREDTYESTTVTIVDDDIILVGFTERNYTFSESDNMAAVDIRRSLISAIPYNVTITSMKRSESLAPSAPIVNGTVMFGRGGVSPIISWPITLVDDNVALEGPEILILSLSSPSHENIQIGGRMEEFDVEWYSNTTVTVVDDDGITVGFADVAYRFSEGDVGNATVIVFGVAAQDFSVLYFNGVQQAGFKVHCFSIGSSEFLNISGELEIAAGMYLTGRSFMIPIDYPDNDVALQNDVVFQMTLLPHPRFLDDVTFGSGGVKGQEDTYESTTVTIVDDDIILVGFTERSYTFSESDDMAAVDIRRSLISAIPYNVTITSMKRNESLAPSAPIINDTVMFGRGGVSPIISWPITLVDDNVPLESPEILILSLSSPSHENIQIGGRIEEFDVEWYSTTTVTVVDDDVPVMCLALTDPANGQVTWTGLTPGSTATYSCDVGYVLNGVATRNCGDDGTWSDDPPTCDLVMCPVLTDPANGQVTWTGLTPGSTATYTCDVGHVLNGVQNRTCRDDGTWSGVPPTCDLPEENVGFEQTSYTFAEDDGVGVVTVLFSPGFTGSVSVVGGPVSQQFVVTSGTEVDETFTSFPAMINLTIVDDDFALEADEQYSLTLTVSDPSVIVEQATTMIVIEDDDRARVTFSRESNVFPEDRSATAIVNLETAIVTGRELLVQVSEQDREDNKFVVQSFFFMPISLPFTGQGIERISLTFVDDDIGRESTERVTLALSALTFPDRVDFSPHGTLELGITDDDATTLSLVTEDLTVEEGNMFQICTSKDITTIRDVEYNLSTTSNTASGDDYRPNVTQSGILLRNSSLDCITFTAVSDSLMEGDEMFTVSLSADLPPETGIQNIGDSEVVVTIIDVPPPPTPTPTPTLTPSLPPTTPPIPTPTVEPPVEVIDTVIGDPLFTVPIAGRTPLQHLCYEIRGISDQYFNFISDACVSVNAHYEERNIASESKPLHVLNEIAIRAVDNAGACTNILIDRNGCTASVDGAIVSNFSRNGISVSRSGMKYVVSVPNCNETDLEMEVVCEEMNGITMLRFEVTRGTNLGEDSHGLIAQFWNIDVEIVPFLGTLRGVEPGDDVYTITIKHPSSDPRSFPAWREVKTWDNRRDCYYIGNQNGGTVFELPTAHDSFIEGDYREYVTGGQFNTDFKYSRFDEGDCSV